MIPKSDRLLGYARLDTLVPPIQTQPEMVALASDCYLNTFIILLAC